MNFEIRTERLADDAHLIAVVGEADLYTVPELKEELLRAIELGARRVIVDLGQTTLVDSAALGALVSGVKRLRAEGGELAVVCADRAITRIFEITGLDRVFTVHPSRAEAIERLGVTPQPTA